MLNEIYTQAEQDWLTGNAGKVRALMRESSRPAGILGILEGEALVRCAQSPWKETADIAKQALAGHKGAKP